MKYVVLVDIIRLINLNSCHCIAKQLKYMNQRHSSLDCNFGKSPEKSPPPLNSSNCGTINKQAVCNPIYSHIKLGKRSPKVIDVSVSQTTCSGNMFLPSNNIISQNTGFLYFVQHPVFQKLENSTFLKLDLFPKRVFQFLEYQTMDEIQKKR